jgi:hypothetical protein
MWPYLLNVTAENVGQHNLCFLFVSGLTSLWIGRRKNGLRDVEIWLNLVSFCAVEPKS